MSIGNRGGASAPKLAQQQDASSQRQAGEQPSGDNQPDTNSDKPQTALVSDISPIVSSGTEVQTERDQQRADADLQAQQDMAFYALLMLVATFATVIITGAGVWLVKRTLDATLRAVEDTGKATEAMLEANAIARASSERQLRAYVGISRTVITKWEADKGFWVQYEMLNAGQTPAYALKTMVRGFIAEFPLPHELDAPTFESEKSCPLMPGERSNSQVWVECEDFRKTLRDIEEGSFAVYLDGACQYIDAFGAVRQTSFRTCWRGEKARKPVMEMHAYFDGNSAS